MEKRYNLVEWYFERTQYPLKDKMGTYFDKNKRPNYVYVIGNPLNFTFKIGITENVNSRIRSLVTQSGCPLYQMLLLELHSEYDEDSKYIECSLHEYFRNKRTFGEWFKLDVKDLIQIRNLFYGIEGEYIWDNLKDHLRDFFEYGSYCPKCKEKYFSQKN